MTVDLMYPPGASRALLVVGEATSLAKIPAMLGMPGASLALESVPEGSATTLEGDTVTADTIGTFTVVVGTLGTDACRRFECVAAPPAVDTWPRFGKSGRQVWRGIINDPRFDDRSLVGMNPSIPVPTYATSNANEPRAAFNIQHFGAPSPGELASQGVAV